MSDAIKSHYFSGQVCIDISAMGTSFRFSSTTGVEQGCSVSLAIFDLYIDQLELHFQSCAIEAPLLVGPKSPYLVC